MVVGILFICITCRATERALIDVDVRLRECLDDMRVLCREVSQREIVSRMRSESVWVGLIGIAAHGGMGHVFVSMWVMEGKWCG